jgi:hypothetical protein
VRSFLLFSIVLVCSVHAQTPAASPTTNAPSGITLREGYDSPKQYTNAYFGFAIPLPEDVNLQHQQLKDDQTEEKPIFVATALREAKLTAVGITAIPSDGSEQDLQRIVLTPEGKEVQKQTIAGRDFLTTKYSSKKTGTVFRYVTYLRGYALKFTVASFGDHDKKTIERLQESVAHLQFFDPAKAREVAVPGSLPYPIGERPALAANVVNHSLDEVARGSISQGMYSNSRLQMSFAIPQGWDILTPEEQEIELERSHNKVHGDDPQQAEEHNQANQCMRRLFWGKQNSPSPTDQAGGAVFLAAVAPECLRGVRIPLAGASDAEISAFVDQMKSGILSQGANIKFAPVQRRNANGQFLLDQSGTAAIQTSTGAPDSLQVSMMFLERNGYLLYWIASAKTKAELEALKNAFSFFVQ